MVLCDGAKGHLGDSLNDAGVHATQHLAPQLHVLVPGNVAICSSPGDASCAVRLLYRGPCQT